MVADIDRVLAQIDKEELADLAITVGNIDGIKHLQAWQLDVMGGSAVID